MKRKLLWIGLAALAIIVPILASSPWVQAQMQALELIGPRPFLRLQGTEAGGHTFEVRENAGSISFADVSLGIDLKPITVVSAIAGGTTACTNGGTDDTLLSYSVPAGTLSSNYKGLEIQAWGATAANYNAKRLKLIVGGTTLVDSGSLVHSATAWLVEATYLRYGAATQDAIGLWADACPLTVGPTRTTPTDNTANAILIRVTGNCGTAGDLTGIGMIVKLLN